MTRKCTITERGKSGYGEGFGINREKFVGQTGRGRSMRNVAGLPSQDSKGGNGERLEKNC